MQTKKENKVLRIADYFYLLTISIYVSINIIVILTKVLIKKENKILTFPE